MDFDEWWNSDHERENMYVSTHARAAWDYQQQRIAELEEENQRLREALIGALSVGLPPHDVSGSRMWEQAKAALREGE